MIAKESSSTIVEQLAPLLSPKAALHLPGSEDFARTTARWTPGEIHPTYAAAVEVATEQDVSEAIKFANGRGVPFLAQAGGHGFWKGLNDVQDGIQIYLRGLNRIKLNEENGGKTAFIGGGALSLEITKALYALGKYAVTGVCSTTSLAGPALGGGHGFLQGYYGLMADNIVSARVVLADGSTVVANKDSHVDLYWGLRGAGHNFGIVTELEYRVFDVPANSRWIVATYNFKQDKLESVMETANKFIEKEANPPRELTIWISIVRNPEVDTERAMVSVQVQYSGSNENAAPYRAPFEALSPVSTDEKIVTEYWKLAEAMGFGEDSFETKQTYDLNVITASLTRFNPKAMRNFYEILNEYGTNPGAEMCLGMIEVYSSNASKEVPPDSTAVSAEERRNNILTAALLIHDLNDIEQSKVAWGFGRRLKAALVAGVDEAKDGKSGSYVNYASGEQTQEELYGFEPWRLAKLRDLKKRYDPEGKFRYYAPIKQA